MEQEARKKGVFRAMFEFIREQAKADPMIKCIRLYVDVDNVNAQNAYKRIGMRKLENTDFYESDFFYPM